MSFLEQIKKNRLSLKATETQVTYADGRKAIECKDKVRLLDEKSHGFVVDTKPDTVPACILDNKLYLGSQDSVDISNIQSFGLTHILSVGIDTPNVDLYSNVACKYVPCLDLPETDLKAVCEESNQFIADALNNNGKVLVHCNAGVSRSTSVVIGYLITCKRLSFNEAYDLVKSKRPCIQPNAGFLKQLKEF